MAIHLSSISATFFVNLLNRLGVKPPPPDGFDLINTVQPVSIVDSDISIPAVTAPALIDTCATQGDVAAPVAATLLADAGAVAAGGNFHYVISFCSTFEGNGTTVEVVRRNAANNADIWKIPLSAGVNACATSILDLRVTLAANERIIVRMGIQNGAAASTYHANIWTIA